MDTNDGAGDITVVKISPQAGTTFLPKSVMTNLVSKQQRIDSTKTMKKMTVSQKLKLTKSTGSTSSLVDSATLKTTTVVKLKPNILLGNKRKSCPVSLKEKQVSPSKSRRKSEIVPLPLEAYDSFKSKYKENDEIICLSDTTDEIDTSSTTTCAFCHFRSNQFHGIGCLYGPYKISSSELVKEIQKSTANEYKIEINSNQCNKEPLIIPKIELKEENLECNITVPDVKISTPMFKKRNCLSVGNTNLRLKNNAGVLQVHQALDHLLVDQSNPIIQGRLKRSNPVLLDDKIRIPGLKDKCMLVRKIETEKNATLPNIETINVMQDNISKLSIKIKEIWTHGYCALYASGVYAIGERLYGLHEAVESAGKVKCKQCGQFGATIAASSNKHYYHYPCAIKNNITLINFYSCEG